MANRSIAELRSDLNQVTAMLCDVCGLLPDEARSAELSAWYAKHQAEDQRRRQDERIRNEAIKTEAAKAQERKAIRSRLMRQLSREEKEALGLR